MRLMSLDFNDNDTLPLRHVFNGRGYHGENLSPHLAWDALPEGTKSVVVTCYDPDAPTGSGWWHWVVVNIPVDVTSLPRGVGSEKGTLPPPAIQTRTDFGQPGYGGAAPPAGESHRYIFSVYALDVATLEVDAESSGALVGFQVNQHKLASASISLPSIKCS